MGFGGFCCAIFICIYSTSTIFWLKLDVQHHLSIGIYEVFLSIFVIWLSLCLSFQKCYAGSLFGGNLNHSTILNATLITDNRIVLRLWALAWVENFWFCLVLCLTIVSLNFKAKSCGVLHTLLLSGWSLSLPHCCPKLWWEEDGTEKEVKTLATLSFLPSSMHLFFLFKTGKISHLASLALWNII
jgi:hypothetical protein